MSAAPQLALKPKCGFRVSELRQHVHKRIDAASQLEQLASGTWYYYTTLVESIMIAFQCQILLPLLAPLSSLLGFVEAHDATCKSTPTDTSWPSTCQWVHLNESLSGRLLRPSPSALACHSSYPGSQAACSDITTSWSTFSFHQNDPVSTAWNNMNNDSCLPETSAPCSGLGYPVYVVNASSASDVKLAIDFARDNNVRLNVKASGHDYLKR